MASGGDDEKSRARSLRDWFVLIAFVVLGALILRTFVFQTYFIPSGSMEPTLQISDRIIVWKMAYDFSSVHRGDVVVFAAPASEGAACEKTGVSTLVKRVVGLPGEVISSQGNNILINGKVLAQPWSITQPLGHPIPRTYIPRGTYFVMGDNRADSCDSRYWGVLPGGNIVGEAYFKIWPMSHVGGL